MADNSTRLDAASATETLASDDVGGVKYQRVKLVLGTDGAADCDVDSGQQTMAYSLPVAIASNQSSLGVQPFVPLALATTGYYELVGINDQVDTNEYGDSVAVALGGTYSGEVIGITLYAFETDAGTGGAIQDSQGRLMVFSADPGTTAGAASMSTAGWRSLLGVVNVTPADWITDSNGGACYICDQPIAFPALSTLYLTWFHTDSTSLNDAAADNESLTVNLAYRRES